MWRYALPMGALLVAVVGCSGAQTRETGLSSSLGNLDRSSFPCNRSEEMQEYVRNLWSSIQSKWVPPQHAKSDQVVVLALDFDGRGESQPPRVIEANDSELQKTVEEAYRRASAPEPSETLRACLAGQRVKATFSARRE
jgi:hypothetical protein